MNMELAKLDSGNITVVTIDFADVSFELNETHPAQEDSYESR
jgi:hypothetical protein